MKKTLFIILLFLILPLSAFAFSVSPNPALSNQEAPYGLIYCDSSGYFIGGYYETGEAMFGYYCNTYSPEPIPFSTTVQGKYYIIQFATQPTGGVKTYIEDKLESENYISEVELKVFDILPKVGILFGRSGESQEANQSGGSMLAAVGLVTTNAFSGVFPYLMLSVGVFIALYIAQKIIMLVGSMDKTKKKK